MPIDSGVYIITNVKQGNLVILEDPNDKTPLRGHYGGNILNERWLVTRLRNGRHSIQNVEYKRYANCGSRAGLGDSVEGHDTVQQWELQEYSPGKYTITATDTGNVWMLPDCEPLTPVGLCKIPSDPRCWWTFTDPETNNAPVNEKDKDPIKIGLFEMKHPPPSYFLDGMELGAGVNAITGEITQSALERDFGVRDVPTTHTRDTFSFRATRDMTELETSDALGFSGSVTFPVDGVKVGTFNFTSSTTESSSSVLLIVFDWERRGNAQSCFNMKLNADARLALKSSSDKDGFRKKYGDYFVYQVSYTTKFTAVWKCISEKSSDMRSFEQEISGSLSAGEMEASGSFTTKLSRAANKHNVTVDVQYQVVGDAGKTNYDHGDVLRTFNTFRDATKPIPYSVLLRPYNTIDPTIPLSIKMDPAVFERVCNVFTLARFVLFLIGVVPGTRSVRLDRRNNIASLFSRIHAKRTQLQNDTAALESLLQELAGMRDMLWLRLQRQDLVIEMHSLTYENMKRSFAVDHENVRGAWVQSSQNQNTYVLGRTGFNNNELKKYAVRKATAIAEVQVDALWFQQQVGALQFPGASGINGYVVGLTVENCWRDGTNGFWCIGSELELGTKHAKVEVKTEGSRGMHWRLHAYYIPSEEYDE